MFGRTRAYGRGAPNLSRQAMAGKQEKAERLAAALRENLRKRKAQARASDQPKDPSQPASE